MLRLLKKLLARWEHDVGAPAHFTAPTSEIVKKLKSNDERSSELLDEARRLFDSVDEHSEGVERRATTLQGVVSIAATLAVAGGALLLDPGKVHGLAWHIVFALLFAALLFCFIATAYRATQASTEIKVWSIPAPEGILKRALMAKAEAEAELAGDLLKCYGRNFEVFRWKVAYMRAASEWFLRGLIFLLAIAITFGAYAVTHAKTAASDRGHQVVCKRPARTQGGCSQGKSAD